MARRNDRRTHKRRAPHREPVPAILVVCEGKATEPEYLEKFRVAVGNSLVRVELVSGAGDPKAIVERALNRMRSARSEAKRLGDDFLAFDSVWCVFDVDSHPRLNDALQQARDTGLRVALSNPCFELWLALHFVDQFAYLDRDSARRLVAKHCSGYDKHIDFELFRPGYPSAVKRAGELRRRRSEANDERGNPSTDVDELTELIAKYGRSSGSRQ